MDSDVFQILNHHLLAQYQQQQQQQQQNNYQTEDDGGRTIRSSSEEAPPSYHTKQSSSMANFMLNNNNNNVNNNNNGNNSAGKQTDSTKQTTSDDHDHSMDNPYQIDQSIINEDILQRQFNLYRYYISQYPELFYEYFQNQRLQQEQEERERQGQQSQQQQQQQSSNNKSYQTTQKQPPQDDSLLKMSTSINNNNSGNSNSKNNKSNYHRDHNHHINNKKPMNNQNIESGSCKPISGDDNGSAAAAAGASSGNTTGGGGKCPFICRCSKLCQTSDSSIWSEQSETMMNNVHNHQHSGHNHQHEMIHQPSTLMLPNQATSNTLYYLNANHLLEDERYEHLSRVITPPNAFLNNGKNSTIHNHQHHHHHHHQNLLQPTRHHLNNDQTSNNDQQQKQIEIIDNNNFHYDVNTGKSVLYSDKRTQTDNVHLVSKQQIDVPTQPTYQKVDKLTKRLQRQLSLMEDNKNKTNNNKIYGPLSNVDKSQNRLSFESSDHIYYTILDRTDSDNYMNKTCSNNQKMNSNKIILSDQSNNKGFWRSKSEKQLKTFEKNNNGKKAKTTEQEQKQKLRNHIQALLEQQKQQNQMENVAMLQSHHVPTSKNGIPCACERCRESRGMNLTTELLPLDTQIPLNTMDNMDSFFQDSSMAELICTIM